MPNYWDLWLKNKGLLSMYKAKVDNWISKRTMAEIVRDADAEVSFYLSAEKKIVLNDDTERVRYHEFGHDIFMTMDGRINVTELCHLAINWGLFSQEEVDAYLELIVEEYGVSKDGIVPFSDFFCGNAQCRSSKYRCHDPEYYNRMHKSSILQNEFFANVVSVIGRQDPVALQALMTICPIATNGCLDILDRALREMPMVA